ncbi:ATP-binding protein [Methanocalculus sp. MSAO_Arc1]|uniref:ATP-binding protein n=2 Tax=Methanocalculaceae TaxID=1460864 RepID=UPI0025F5C2E2|nr:ATP-binding protein [Methanocalculus sp. MSAO_Arc1]
MITIIIIMRFYGRRDELRLMEHLYAQSPSFLVVTGRRRVGKTELILEFCKEKPAIYFYVDANKSIGSLLEEFSRLMRETLNLPGYVRLETPEAFLEFLFSYREPLVVVFDEFQRFQKIDPSFISQLQRYWDTSRRNSSLFIIVSGSSVGMIREIFLSGGAPLFKRADTILTLKPFGPEECLAILGDIGVLEPDDRLDLYLLFGGAIYYYTYLEKFGCTDMESALSRLLLNDFAPLAYEMRDIVVEVFGREHATYYEILAAIASGKQSQKEIADAIHIAPTSLPTYLRDLIDLLGIIEYRTPVTERGRRSKMGRYIFSDNFFRFYARYIYRNRSLYQSGRYGKLLNLIQDEWKGFSGFAFEEMVRTLLRESLIPEYDAVGSWWNRRGDEIDLLALSGGADLVVEIKNTTLTRSEAYSLLTSLQAKLPAVQGLSEQVTLGIAAREIEDREELREEGFYCMEIEEMLGQNTMKKAKET